MKLHRHVLGWALVLMLSTGPALAQPGGTAGGNAARPGSAGAMDELDRIAFAQRRRLFDIVDKQIKATRDALRKIQADAHRLKTEGRSDFKSALVDVRARERELAESLKASRKSTEATWANDRETLVSAYRSHTDAMARLDAAAHSTAP